ncbi:peptide chain release factor-like protein [Patescibacteria group bacterium]|nr:peptide chain release factor-like protein [Patescibacteria group bacterium]
MGCVEFPVKLAPDLLEKAARLHVEAEDISERFVRGSGSGGQKINKTSNAVWLKHLPTGIEVKVQKHRELTRNRMSAYKLLILKIEERVLGAESERAKKVFKIRKQKMRRSRKAKEKMLEEKAKRGNVKKMRGKVDFKE